MTVKLRPGETQEALLKRFRKEDSQSRILSAYRQKRWFISKSELRRKEKKKSRRKALRRQAKMDRHNSGI